MRDWRDAVGRSRRRILAIPAAALVIALLGVGAFGVASSAATATCTIYWTGATSSDWSTTSNWSLTSGGGSAGRLPGAPGHPADFVCMSTSPVRSSAVISSGTVTIGGIDWPKTSTVTPSLEVSGSSTLNLGDSTAVDPSTIDELTVSGAFLVSFSGETVTAANLTLASDPRLEGPGTLTVSGTAGLGPGALGVQGVTADALHLVLEGASTMSSGSLDLYGGSELENKGTLTLGDGSDLFAGDKDANEVLNDSGATISYTGSASNQSATVDVMSANDGTVSVGAGTLNYGVATSTDSGAFKAAAAGATLNLLGTRTEAAGATLSGLGTIDVQGAVTLTTASNLGAIGTFEVNGGTLTVTSGQDVTAPNLTLIGSRLEGPGTLTVSGPASLGTSTSPATLGQAFTPAVAAHLVLQGASTTPANATLSVFGSSVLENEGTLTLADGSVLNGGANSTAEVLNDAGATISYTGSASNQSASVAVPAENDGTVSVGAGTLAFGDKTSTDSGAFKAAAGATLNLLGTRTEAAGATLSGLGTIDVQGAVTLTTASNLGAIGTFEVDGGTLTVTSGQDVTAPNLTLVGSRLEGPGTLTVSGPASLGTHSSPAVLGLSGTPAVAAHLVLQGASTTPANATLSVFGSSVLENEGTLTLADGSVINAGTDKTSQVVNDPGGTISYTGSASTNSATLAVALKNNGTVVANEGAVVLDTLTNLSSAGDLSGGTYTTAGGTISLPHAVSTNDASVVLGVVPSAFTVSGSGNALSGLVSNGVGGSLDLKQSLPQTGSLGSVANSGSVTVENSSALSVSSYSQSGGMTVVVGGSTLESGSGSGDVAIDGGTLAGTGTVAGDVFGSGDVRPSGTVADTMLVTGTYDNSSGTLTIPISGTANPGTDFGQLSVGGVATLGGALTFSTKSGYLPPVGHKYTILKAASVSGMFASINGALIGASEKFVVSYTATAVVATVVAVPDVLGVSPSAGPTAGGISVTISGSGFTGATAVMFGGSAASITGNSGTQITATTPAEVAGTVDVTVTTPNGTSELSPADHYSFDAPPTLSSVNPTAGPTKGAQKVTLTGTNFVSGATTVDFGASAASSVTWVSSTKVTALTPAHGAGTVKVTVTTPGGITGFVNYTYDPLPAIASVSPDTGTTAGGTMVTITGSGFLPSGTIVKFGSAAASSFTVNSATQITASAPAEPAGSVNVTVSTPGGTSAITSKDLYGYGAPTVTSFTPASGITGSKVTVKGTGFVPGVSVMFGSLSSPTVTVTSATVLTAVVPNGASTGTISVTDGQGTGTGTTSYTVKLSITGFGPPSGPTGTLVTINGVGFLPTSKVRFNGVAAATVTFDSSTELQATVPAGATTGPITVTNLTTPTGTVTSPTNYTVP